jgi:hypothetical protein
LNLFAKVIWLEYAVHLEGSGHSRFRRAALNQQLLCNRHGMGRKALPSVGGRTNHSFPRTAAYIQFVGSAARTAAAASL